LYGIPLPARLSALVAGEKAAFGLAKKAVDALLAGEGEHVARSRRLAGLRNAFYFKRIRPAVPFGLILKELFMCPVDYVTFPLPDSLFWMYVPLRPFFWFWRHYGGRIFAGVSSIGKA
jgi:hypothetical protein